MKTETTAALARVLAIGAACSAFLTASAAAQGASGLPGYRSTVADREQIAITVYNQNFGLVREVRTIALHPGVITLEFGDVASQIQPETVHIKSLGGERLDVLEQNYQFDLLSPQKLLEKYVGRTVKVYRWNAVTGRDEEHEAEVLSVNQGTILKVGDEISFNYPGRISFPEIPENLIAKPTLLWRLDSERSHARVEVSYLTRNMTWKADYVLVIDEDDREGHLTGWVTLTNQSGAAYKNARLKLVAGDVQRVGQEVDRAAIAGLKAAERRSDFVEEGFFEYHLYTLDRPATLLENEQKQVTLLEAAGIGLEKRLIYYGAAQYYRGQYGQVMSNQKVGVYLDVQNSEANQLGLPMPKGVVRVYKADRSGAQQFVGEDRIDHTPRDERIRIKMGEAFDVVGERRQVEFRVLSSCVSESAWEVKLRNHKDELATIEAFEPVGGDWTLLSSSHPSARVDAHTFKFVVDVPARDEAQIDYRVRVRWC